MCQNWRLTILAILANNAAMQISDWRHSRNLSLDELAKAVGFAGGARSFHRVESGQSKADSDLVERIVALTGGAVTAEDMHRTRLAWLRANRPEKFAPREAAE